jgi:regulator of cell morphogenesis and NO signaling
MTVSVENTIGEIVARDFRAAAVFQRHGIDFCCGGARSLETACEAKRIPASTLLAELDEATREPAPGLPRFDTWRLPVLAAYIVDNHHAYVRQSIPLLLTHTKKVAAVHGENHPEMVEVANLFQQVADEMTSHMAKEEQILFPFITEMAEAADAGRPQPPSPFGTVRNPIRMMEHEHDDAGRAMERIHELTAGYAPPAGACTTYRVCLQELDAFERDLHQHVHLENNILFPKAASLEGRQ